MSSRTRIIENSKKPAIGGGRMYSVPLGPSMSSRIARDARPSSTVRASDSRMPQSLAARRAVTGRIGQPRDEPRLRSVNSSARIRYSRSDGGAPWGNRLSRSVSAP